MNYAIYIIETGRIVQVATGPLESIEDILQTGQACLEVSGGVSNKTHYIDDDEPVEKGVQPSPAHIWDWDTKAWIDPRTLADHKTARLALLKAARDAHLNGGFTWDGSDFDSDLVSQTRLLGLKIKAQGDPGMSETWRLQDNSWRTLDDDDALAVWDTFEDHLRDSFISFAALEADVVAATTVEEVEAVVWA